MITPAKLAKALHERGFASSHSVRILNPGCVAKTYPQFFDDLEQLRR